MDLAGVIPPMVTPTTDNTSDVDTEALVSFTKFLVDGGVHGVFPCGSIGEFTSLTREQRSTVIETVARNSGDLPVIAGCGGTSVPVVSDLIADAAGKGADAAVVVTPYYLQSTGDGLETFYTRLIENTPLPIILYEIPSRTGNRLSIDVISKLADFPDVIGIKDSTGDVTRYQRLIESTPDSFTVLQGLTEFAIMSLDFGADAFVAGPANVYPEVLSTMYETYHQGDRELAIDLWKNVSTPIVAATKPVPTAAGLKYLLHCRGQNVGKPLPPLSVPSKQQQKRLEECHQKIQRWFQKNGSEVAKS